MRAASLCWTSPPGLLVEIEPYTWDPTGGGWSGAAFAVIGGLSLNILQYHRTLPVTVLALSIAGNCAGVVLCVARDDHGGRQLGGDASTPLRAAAVPSLLLLRSGG